MKQKHLNQLCAGAFITLLAGGFSSCMEKDLYDPENGKNKLLPKEEYFDFELRGDVKLSVNYNAPGYNQVFFMIFSENPVVTPGTLKLKEGVQPIYSAFTGKDGKYEGVMKIPTAVTEAWIYTDRLGVSGCVKMNLAGEVATYDAAANSARSTRAAISDSQLSDWLGESMPYCVFFGREEGMAESLWKFNYFSVVKWGAKGGILGKNNDVYMAEYADNDNKFPIADISQRATAYFKTIPKLEQREELLRSASVLNVKTTEDNTKLQIVFLDEAAENHNVFGYYYYKKGAAIESGEAEYLYEDLTPIKKYVLFPNLSKESDLDGNGALAPRTAVKLKFFGEKGNEAAREEFPADYVIGWFLMSNGFQVSETSKGHPQYSIIDAGRISDPGSGRWGSTVTSNDMKSDKTDFRRFISLYDQTSNSLVIGVEDRVGDNFVPDDYMDLTFIVTSNKGLTDKDKPVIPPVVKPDLRTEIQEGTLAFEDMWPTDGDYDLNDVVVEYVRAITYDEKNFAISAEEKFTFKQDPKSADNEDFFAYVAKWGTVEASNDLILEGATKSVVIKKSAKAIMNDSGSKTFTVKRTFEKGMVGKDAVIADFDPYIIIGAYTDSNRKEVHLPKRDATAFADQTLSGKFQDAYYIDFQTGEYPFAINIPILNFVQVTEKARIDTDGEYPGFKAWVKSGGETNQKWYESKK